MNAHVLKLFCSDVQKISGSAQVNSGKNRRKQRNQSAIKWQVLFPQKKYGAVSYLFSCTGCYLSELFIA